ncbi:sodium:glutamate symporter [Nesterenkonia sp. MY13]|uniref:Sodium:glutamate symporter n=1 Tax=Nesterenkonia sedimenti TaxID=1463632 RepID=A0A7X8TJI1_9MICC|nr:sodium:glutamate symporter [Nesterenkonia sedimenti]NLS09721.1 sodium:glutamate symporter [Nesterenkonia sedimenti]
MEFTPWTLLTDLGLIGLLLVIGTIIRAKLRPVQSLLIPASVIAGFLGLFLGPEFLGLLPFSEHLGTYASVLIAVIFACLAFAGDFDLRKIGRPLANFASYSVLIYSSQVAIGALVGLAILAPLLGTPDGFGLLLFAGWVGGFGSAAAIGGVFEDSGWEGAQSLAFTSATVGMLIAIIGGVIQAKVAANRGHVNEFQGMRHLPRDIRTGVLDGDEDPSPIGNHRFSSASIESLMFQVSIIVALTAGAYGVNEILGGLFPDVAFPLFSLAFILGLVLRWLMSVTSTSRHMDKESLRSISGSSTDVLVVCGIASIAPSVVADNWLALTILFVVGLGILLVLGLVMAPRVLGDAWFEKQLFTWGWGTGTVAMGIAMLRIVDPRLRSNTLEQYSVATIPNTAVEITAVTFTPVLVLAGSAWAVVGIYGAIAVVGLAIPLVLLRGQRQAAKSGAA